MGGRGRWISESEASLIYRVSSRTARTAQRNTVSKKKKKEWMLRQGLGEEVQGPGLREVTAHHVLASIFIGAQSMVHVCQPLRSPGETI